MLRPCGRSRGSRGAPGLSLLFRRTAGYPALQARRQGDFQRFLEIIRQFQGDSSYMYLQNVSPAGAVKQQDMAITLALCEHYLEGTGAYRVHGGGFAGTCQAFVPMEKLEAFRAGIDGVLGEGACHVLTIRPQGGAEVTV